MGIKTALKLIAPSVVILLVAACSSTPEDLQAKSTPVVQTYKENYQEIYRRVSTTAKRCFAGNVLGVQASVAVDSEIYSELGYGELTLSLINMGTRNYYLSVKVAKQLPVGSTLTVQAGNTLASERYKELILRWANGDQDCPVV